MTIQRYPVGQQDFGEIRRNGFIYVDKTEHIFNLLTQNKYYFLSRPRRFGKSLLISTIECILKGQKELFKGLYIEDKWVFEEYPIIRISFSNIGYRESGLEIALTRSLKSNAAQYGLTLIESDTSQSFKELIQALHKKYKKQVVVLIDEYDKPIIDYLDKENIHIAREHRSVMKTFYSILKDADPYLKLVFITGVSKFSQVSIFSDLNNLFDLTFSPNFSSICGITQKELETNFIEELKIHDVVKIKEWYNGYRWDMDGPSLYNPFSLLKFFSDNGKYYNHWFATGTPTFLMDMAKAQKFYDITNLEVSSFLLSNFDIDKMEIVPILFQTGYLTIVKHDWEFDRVKLDYPNREVRASYLIYLTQAYTNKSAHEISALPFDLLDSIRLKNAALLKDTINRSFAQLPYDLWQRENEHFYHAIVHLLFTYLGVYVQSEVHTKLGRADAIINIEEGIFCLEFKLDKTASEAVQQVKDKGYLDAYRYLKKPCFIIGINFSSTDRVVEELIFVED